MLAKRKPAQGPLFAVLYLLPSCTILERKRVREAPGQRELLPLGCTAGARAALSGRGSAVLLFTITRDNKDNL